MLRRGARFLLRHWLRKTFLHSAEHFGFRMVLASRCRLRLAGFSN